MFLLLKLLPVTACTISLHLVAVEAHFQVPKTGPVREAVCSWIERLNFTLIEQTQRRHLSSSGPLSTRTLTPTLLVLFLSASPFSCLRRVSASPEKGIIRGYLIELFVRAHSEDLIPLEPLRSVVNQQLYDSNAKEERIQVRGLHREK